MNCFQKLLSSWWRTTSSRSGVHGWKLWIAFKNYYLRDEEQRTLRRKPTKKSCELLSKIIIFVMKNNSIGLNSWSRPVVNCFQKLLSSWWRTTNPLLVLLFHLLWIAFKNYYLRDEEQPQPAKNIADFGCELLSKIIIFVMKNNYAVFLNKIKPVVNCFQKLLSSWWRTTLNASL